MDDAAFAAAVEKSIDETLARPDFKRHGVPVTRADGSCFVRPATDDEVRRRLRALHGVRG